VPFKDGAWFPALTDHAIRPHSLAFSTRDPDREWPEALRHAAGSLPPGDPLAHIFYEERDDLRVEMGRGRAPEVVRTRLRGLRVRRGGPRPVALFLAASEPSEAVALVRRLMEGGGDGRTPFSGRRPRQEISEETKGVVGLLEGIRTRLERPGEGPRISVEARWVAFRQRIHVATPDRVVQTDQRVGSRVRLEARVEGPSGVVARAVGERVLRLVGEDLGLDELADGVARRARERTASRAPVRGETPVVFAPGVGGILIHELVGHALEADTVLRGASVLARQRADVAPPEVTVLDDPRRGRGGWKLDDEGSVSRATSLLERGKVAGWLHDRFTSRRAGREPTGHGRRSSFREPVRPRMGCTFLKAGRLAAEEVVSETRQGIYIRRMEAASTDSFSGIATFRVTDADRIDQGRLGSPLDSFLLRVNTLPALSGLDLVGDDLRFDTCVGSCLRDGQPLATSVGAPTYRIEVARVVV